MVSHCSTNVCGLSRSVHRSQSVGESHERWPLATCTPPGQLTDLHNWRNHSAAARKQKRRESMTRYLLKYILVQHHALRCRFVVYTKSCIDLAQHVAVSRQQMHYRGFLWCHCGPYRVRRPRRGTLLRTGDCVLWIRKVFHDAVLLLWSFQACHNSRAVQRRDTRED